MKRILSALLAIAMLITCTALVVPVGAAEEDLIVETSATVIDPKEGEGKLKVTVSAKENSGVNTLVFELGYNAGTLRLEEIENGEIFYKGNGGSLAFTNTDTNPARLYFEHEGVENIGTTGPIATVTFTIIDEMGDFDINVVIDRVNTYAVRGSKPVDVTTKVVNSITVNTQHTLSSETVPPTCTEPGTTVTKCTVCEKIISQETFGTPKDHKWNETSRFEPTYSTKGRVDFTCTECGETKSEVLPMLEPIKGNLNGLYTVKDGKLTLKLDLRSNPGVNTLVANLAYNADALELDSITNGNVFSEENGGSLFNVNTARNPLILCFEQNGTSNISANGTLATLVFTVKDETADYGLVLSVDDKNTIAADENLNLYDVPFNEPTVKEQLAKLGDINGDGKVTAIDSFLLKRIIVATFVPDAVQRAVADINGDGKITAIDSYLIKKIIVGTYIPN